MIADRTAYNAVVLASISSDCDLGIFFDSEFQTCWLWTRAVPTAKTHPGLVPSVTSKSADISPFSTTAARMPSWKERIMLTKPGGQPIFSAPMCVRRYKPVNTLLRILQNQPRQYHVTDSVTDLYIQRILLLVHNFVYHKDKLPEIFNNYFMFNNEIHKL